jgi:hypothetical protein
MTVRALELRTAADDRIESIDPGRCLAWHRHVSSSPSGGVEPV